MSEPRWRGPQKKRGAHLRAPREVGLLGLSMLLCGIGHSSTEAEI